MDEPTGYFSKHFGSNLFVASVQFAIGFQVEKKSEKHPQEPKKQQINKYATMPQQVKHIQCPMFFTLEAGGARRNHSPHAL